MKFESFSQNIESQTQGSEQIKTRIHQFLEGNQIHNLEDWNKLSEEQKINFFELACNPIKIGPGANALSQNESSIINQPERISETLAVYSEKIGELSSNDLTVENLIHSINSSETGIDSIIENLKKMAGDNTSYVDVEIFLTEVKERKITPLYKWHDLTIFEKNDFFKKTGTAKPPLDEYAHPENLSSSQQKNINEILNSKFMANLSRMLQKVIYAETIE